MKFKPITNLFVICFASYLNETIIIVFEKQQNLFSKLLKMSMEKNKYNVKIKFNN